MLLPTRFLPFLLALPSTAQGAGAKKHYKVVAERLSTEPLISKSLGAVADFNYNAALYTTGGPTGSVVTAIIRSQNLKDLNVPWEVGPSFITLSSIHFDAVTGQPIAAAPSGTIFPPDPVAEAGGTEDPRISWANGTYYMTYTAYDGKAAMLSVATNAVPMNQRTWVRQGFALPDLPWSKSGAILFATSENGLKQHFMFWGDSSTPEGGIGVITSTDAKSWSNAGDYLFRIREDSFDSELVESGGEPIQLKSGDFLFIYNSAQRGHPSVKPEWELQYNIGYVILDGADPTTVVERSDSPILSPELEWEIGNTRDYLTPNVVFLEGLVKDPRGCPSNVNELIGDEYVDNAECFFGVYGGADSVLGSVRIVASWSTTPPTTTGAAARHSFALLSILAVVYHAATALFA